jgi:hypothetical protein
VQRSEVYSDSANLRLSSESDCANIGLASLSLCCKKEGPEGDESTGARAILYSGNTDAVRAASYALTTAPAGDGAGWGNGVTLGGHLTEQVLNMAGVAGERGAAIRHVWPP